MTLGVVTKNDYLDLITKITNNADTDKVSKSALTILENCQAGRKLEKTLIQHLTLNDIGKAKAHITDANKSFYWNKVSELLFVSVEGVDLEGYVLRTPVITQGPYEAKIIDRCSLLVKGNDVKFEELERLFKGNNKADLWNMIAVVIELECYERAVTCNIM